jgi:hypothetical protein
VKGEDGEGEIRRKREEGKEKDGGAGEDGGRGEAEGRGEDEEEGRRRNIRKDGGGEMQRNGRL